MPCNCDHMEPSATEIALSKVACLLDEFAGLPFNKNHWGGMHPKVYSQTYDRYCSPYEEEPMVLSLVEKIMSVDVTKYSLEMQVWWRDYQKNETRLKEYNKLLDAREAKKKVALSKLTAEEKEILGLA